MSSATAAKPFDPACDFLLGMRYENLFYARGPEDMAQVFVCKGCDAEVKRGDREKHHAHHKRIEPKRRARETLKNKQRQAAEMRRLKKLKARENGQ